MSPLAREKCNKTPLQRAAGEKGDEAPYINDGSSPISIFLLHFAEIITLLVLQTHR
jgi:hypothetical protein